MVSLMSHVRLSLTGYLLSRAGNWTISPGVQVSCLYCLKSAVPHKILDSLTVMFVFEMHDQHEQIDFLMFYQPVNNS